MKPKGRVIGAIVLGVLVLLFVLAGPAAPLFIRLGVKPICIQGNWPHFKIVSCPQPLKAAPASTSLPFPTQGGQTPIPIIVDDDGSPDGIIALLYFLRHPLFDVRAVTISCGEAHPDQFARPLMQLLAGLGRADIPVGVGSAKPLEGNNAFPDPWRQSSDAFWNIALPQATVSNEPVPAAELIIETLSRSTQPVAVFVSGNHTNLAQALRLEPGIVEHIRAVYIMGGSIYSPGNIKSDWPAIDNSVAEWNIWVDPVAAREVFASGLPLHVIPLDATDQILWTPSDALGWASFKTPEGALANEMLHWMLNSWSSTGVYIWDLVAAVAASDPALCPAVSLSLDVIVAPGAEQGRTVITKQPANATVCLKPDSEQIKARAAAVLGP